MGQPKKAIKFMTKKKNEQLILDDVRRNEALARLYV